jgi:hypothetical protein
MQRGAMPENLIQKPLVPVVRHSPSRRIAARGLPCAFVVLCANSLLLLPPGKRPREAAHTWGPFV